jgi:hypothetical protein
VTFVLDNDIGSSESGTIEWPGGGIEAGAKQGVEIFSWLYTRHLIEMAM